MGRGSFLVWIWTPICLTVIVSCSSDVERGDFFDKCTLYSDCTSGFCYHNFCSEICSLHSGGLRCAKGIGVCNSAGFEDSVCYPACQIGDDPTREEARAACAAYVDLGLPLSCQEREDAGDETICYIETCTYDWDCPEGFVCEERYCK